MPFKALTASSVKSSVLLKLLKFFRKFFVFNYRIIISFYNSVIVLFLNEDVTEFKNFYYFIILKVVSDNIRKSNKVSYKSKVLIYKFSSLLLSKFMRYSCIRRRVESLRYLYRVRRCMTALG